ncbi:MAG TPA: hypothetical protein VI702_05895, partial [Nitrospiria bacterium]
ESRGPLTAFYRFKMAGMEKEYRSIYNSLCAKSHNDIRALIDRHIEITENDSRVVLYKDESLVDICRYLDAMGHIIVNSSLKLHELLRSDQLPVLKKLLNEFEEARKYLRQST